MKRGYVYKLTDGNKFYIGSTGLTPEKRLAEHKDCSTKSSSQKQPVYGYFKSTNWENVRVETLRECEYTVKGDLLRYEREEYDKVANDENCLNVNRPLISRAELKQQVKENNAKWHQENKEHCKEALQEWRRNNPEKVKAQRQRGAETMKECQHNYYQEHKELKREQVRQWRLANPEKYAEQKKRSIAQINEKRRQAREAKNNVENNTN
jgi:hypothetical protein